jgi:hypothetical protein
MGTGPARADAREVNWSRSSPCMPDSGDVPNERQNAAVGELYVVPHVDPDRMGAVTRSRPRLNTTAPPTEQVDVVAGLGELARTVVEHNRQIMAGEPANWGALADLLNAAADTCRRQIVIDWTTWRQGATSTVSRRQAGDSQAVGWGVRPR